jgi:predicted hotdog family 3-hydroxylacyl-ACP dehydratase
MQPCKFAIDDILFHEAPMILIDRVEAYDDRTVQSSVEITPDSPFLANDTVPAYVSVEYMAQSIAAYSGIKARSSGEEVKIGYLASIRKIDFNAPHFVIGDKLNITVKMIWNETPMAVFDCVIEVQDKVVASARLNVFQP